jgi:UDP-N-acetylglucosamine--N-acetylmuramyl-(pentapeptide) pyrophosphoryl-undecaprenol N-acetylglucosamine transferase
VAIACGGTGGHLFPGLAVAERLVSRGAAVTLLISPKEVDQEAVKSVKDMAIVTLPAVGLTGGQRLAFFRAAVRSYRATKRLFRETPVQAALAMGGFTSAPPILAARRLGARTFLHESNSIPGRANRVLAWFVDRAFVGFSGAASRLHTKAVTVTGTPVRPQFNQQEQRTARAALGLNSTDPVILVTGGSQGASGINSLVERSLPLLAKQVPEWQWFHLTGPADAEKMKRAYAASNVRAVVHPFFDKMEQALGAAMVAVSRAGASSLAELAAVRLPAILVPYPAAVDNHQYHNARAFEESGAARVLEQGSATPEAFSKLLIELAREESARAQIQNALAKWHAPGAAEEIAGVILKSVGVEADEQAGAAAHNNRAGITKSGTKSGASLRRLPQELGRTPA